MKLGLKNSFISRFAFYTAIILLHIFSFCSISDAQNLPKGYVKVKDFAQSQDIAFQWFPLQKMIVLTKDLQVVRLVVNSNKAIVNNQEVELPSPPVLIDGQVYAPAKILVNAFTKTSQPKKEDSKIVSPPPQSPIVTNTSKHQPEIITEDSEEALPILTNLRHSTREDHTRVVLEFSGKISYNTEFIPPSRFKLLLKKCKNLVPVKRSNPIGRDIKNISFTSPPTKDGLVVTFDLPAEAKKPIIETVANPFRIIISFYTNIASSSIVATSTSSSQIIASTSKQSQSNNFNNANTTQTLSNSKSESQQNKLLLSEFAIDVPLLQLTKQSALGRVILIEAAHGGSDLGTTRDNILFEKDITLNIAQYLSNILKSIGLNPILIRNSDSYIPPETRIAQINKVGADFLLSIHVGSSLNKEQEGVSCIWFSPIGLELSDKSLLDNWLKYTRFDVSKLLAQKIHDKLIYNLNVNSRGCIALPASELLFIIHPAIIVEVGMLSNDRESSKLSSKKYHESVAKALANGILDFYNSYLPN